jgi:hypothetical protein
VYQVFTVLDRLQDNGKPIDVTREARVSRDLHEEKIQMWNKTRVKSSRWYLITKHVLQFRGRVVSGGLILRLSNHKVLSAYGIEAGHMSESKI